MEEELEKTIIRMGGEFVKLERQVFDKYSAAGIIKYGKTKKDKSQKLIFYNGESPLEAVQKLEKAIEEYKQQNPKLYE